MNKTGFSFKLALAACLYSFFGLQAALGDDTEVFLSDSFSSGTLKPNVLFVFDTSGSMNRKQSFLQPDPTGAVDADGNPVMVTVSQSRIGIIQDVMTTFLASQSGINMGLSRFSVPGGPILFPVTDPDEPADPIVLKSLVSADDDAVQSGNSVTLSPRTADYLNPTVTSGMGIIGLRFQNVAIPQGAKITLAALQLSTDIDSFSAAEYDIYTEVVPNAAPFEASNRNLSRRLSGISIPWTVEAWDADPIVDPSLDPPTTFETPDISALIQQVVDQKGANIQDPAGWCGGNDLVILLRKKTPDGRPILSYEQNESFSPKLRVDFDSAIPPGEFGCYVNTVYDQVSASERDSEFGPFGLGSTYRYLSLYKDGSRYYNDKVALSFVDIKIPQGAQILTAKLNFTSTGRKTGAASANIHLINSANPPIDTSAHSNNNLTGGVPWAIEKWDYGTSYDSVDFSSAVQSVVNLSGWSDTSDITVIIKGQSGSRNAYSYDGFAGGAPKLEVSFKGRYEPSAATKRGAMIAAVEDFKALGNTPVSDTYAEAGLYFKGEEVTYGLQRGSPTKRDNRISHIDSTKNGLVSTPNGCSGANPSATACKEEHYVGKPVYETPIKEACQPNHIVLLTDGEPTSHDRKTNDLYARWTKELSSTGTASSCATNDRGKECTKLMAGMFQSKDVLLGTPDKETITTHTIGFFTNQTFLEEVAEKGHGKYVTAFSKQALIDALKEIVDSILEVNTTFVSAGVTVNQYNRLTHSDELYFSLFLPSAKTVWPGNLKRYRLLNGKLVDVNDTPAISIEGEFAKTAESWWAGVVDGNLVESGGAAEMMTNNRKVFSNLTGSTDVNLALDANRVYDGNTANIPESLVSADDAAQRTKILKWAIGQDVNNIADPSRARKKMGDPLHSQPTLLIYHTGSGNTESDFRTSVYVGTNEGFLHSFDTKTGLENWSFMPKELLPRLKELQEGTIAKRTYGLDGSVTIHIEESEGSGVPGTVDPGEKAYLYVGMRRGGKSYYAFDVSNPDAPRLKFTVTPSDLPDLGETWSKPVIKKMNIFPGHETVMIIGGGYSTKQDDEGTASQVDDRGKNVYILDAFTGELLWEKGDAIDASGISDSEAGSLSTMNAVPNEVAAFDIDGDGYVDHFYATDTKAQIFRFDVDGSSGKITGGRIAHLQDVGGAVNNRRFYNAPDVSLVRLDTGNFIAIAVGSGYRAHPLDETVTDHFYVVKDEGVLKGVFDMDATVDSSSPTNSDLVDVTLLIGDSDNNGISDAAEVIYDKSSPKNGWYITFPRSGEKVLSNSLTFNNAVVFTTFTPPSAGRSSCNVVAGESRLYGMKIADGTPFVDVDSDNSLTGDDRSVTLDTPGIAPSPQILLEGTLGDGGGVNAWLCVGNQCPLPFVPEPAPGVMGVRWRDQQ